MTNIVKLDGKWRLALEGDTNAYLLCPRSKSNLGYILGRLFNAESVDVSELESWGFKVSEIEQGLPDSGDSGK